MRFTLANNWRPAVMPRRPALSAYAGENTPVAFIDSPMMSLAIDTALVVSSVMLARVYGKVDSSWTSVFWASAAVGTAKGLFDLNQLSNRET